MILFKRFVMFLAGNTNWQIRNTANGNWSSSVNKKMENSEGEFRRGWKETMVCRSSARSAMFIENRVKTRQAPSGAAQSLAFEDFQPW